MIAIQRDKTEEVDLRTRMLSLTKMTNEVIVKTLQMMSIIGEMEATLAQENATDNTSQGVNTTQILGLKSGHISLGIC